MKIIKKVGILMVFGAILALSGCSDGSKNQEKPAAITETAYTYGNTEYRRSYTIVETDEGTEEKDVRWEKVTRKDNGEIETVILMEDKDFYK